MSKLKRMSLMSVAACALIAPVAFGQADNFYSRDKYEAVMDRAQPEYDPGADPAWLIPCPLAGGPER